MRYRFIGEHFFFEKECEENQILSVVRRHRRPFRCRDIDVYTKVRQVLDIDGKSVYTEKRKH